MTSLPIDTIIPEALASLRARPNLVLHAPTGAGKSTRFPGALLRDGCVEGQIVLLEPRRVAARAVARRIAQELGVRLGEEVGYQVRFERRASAATRLLVVTEGVLLRRLQDDPFLDGVGAVLFDEFHERSLEADLTLALCRQVQAEVRPELRLVAMSATLAAEPLAEWLDAPLVRSEGRTFPVAVEYLDARSAREAREAGPGRGLELLVARGVRRALAEVSPEGNGDVLVFLPGVGEIRRCEAALAGLTAAGAGAGAAGGGDSWPEATIRPGAAGAAGAGAAAPIEVLSLYGELSAEQQDRVFEPGARRRVILATNVAETSLTLPRIGAVVDSGLVRVMRHDPGSGFDRLVVERVSAASAEQRAGRAGRLGPGRAYRLWTEGEQQRLAAFTEPDVRRVDLSATVLELLRWGTTPEVFPWYEAPPAAHLAAARGLLEQLGLTEGGALTSAGRRAAQVPAHPRLACMLLRGVTLGEPELAATVAAMLGERDVLRADAAARRTATGSESDVLDRLDALTGSARGGALQAGAAQAVRRAADQLLRLVGGDRGRGGSERGGRDARDASDSREARGRSSGASGGDRGSRSVARDGGRFARGDDRSAATSDALTAVLLAGYPDRLCRRRDGETRQGLSVEGRGVVLDPRTSVQRSRWFIALSLDADRGGADAHCHLAHGLDEDQVPAQLIRSEEVYRFDEASGRVQVLLERRVGAIVLSSTNAQRRDPARVEAVLRDALLGQPSLALPDDDEALTQLINRLRFVAAHVPDADLPSWDDTLRETLITALCAGAASVADVRRRSAAETLEGLLGWAATRTLNELAPARLTVPSGEAMKLTWQDDGPPILAVKIQQMFGCAQTPTVARGRVPVLLHLLAPNGRPQQVTQDLTSFWNTTWQEVRKELRQRYPRHPWPEDPWTAPPTRRAKPRSGSS